MKLKPSERLKILEDGSLVINDISEKDLGEYECVSRNKLGDARIFIRIKERLSLSSNNEVGKVDEFIFEEYQDEEDYEKYLGKSKLFILFFLYYKIA